MSKDLEIGIKQLAWLFERMAAKQDPVTPEQLQCFAKFHEGQILSPECIEAKRLPYGFGYERGGKNYVTGLALGPNDEPCLLFVHDEKYKCLIGDKEYGLVRVGDIYGWGIALLGFTPDSLPVTSRTFRYNVSDLAVCGEWELLSSADYILRIGERDVWKSQGIFASAMSDRGNNTLIFCRALAEKENHFMIGCWDAATNTETVLVPDCDKAVRRFAVVSPKKVYCFWSERKPGEWRFESEKHYVGEICDGSVIPFDIPLNGRGLPDFAIEDVVELDGQTFFLAFSGAYRQVSDSAHEYYRLLVADGKKFVSVDETVTRNPFVENDYRGCLTRIQPNLLAFRGMTKRDRLRCWYVDGIPGPAFNAVSPLFRRDGQWLYYACAGRHLFTMELIVPQSVLDKLAEEEDGRRRRAEWRQEQERKNK